MSVRGRTFSSTARPSVPHRVYLFKSQASEIKHYSESLFREKKCRSLFFCERQMRVELRGREAGDVKLPELFRSHTNVAHVKETWPESGLSFQVKALRRV